MSELIDFPAMRAELRILNRGSLLIIVERAIEMMPVAQLHTLLSDFVQLSARAVETGNTLASQPDDVRAFYHAAMAGKYYETIELNNRGRREQSQGTDAFIAEFHRLLHKCIRTTDQAMLSRVSESYALLFRLLSYIDEGHDDVLFFAEDGSSSDVGVNWRTALPAYFNCLTRTVSPKDFARTVNETVSNFVSYDRAWYWDMARNIATDAQRIALDAHT